jgi:hypothetical protein
MKITDTKILKELRDFETYLKSLPDQLPFASSNIDISNTKIVVRSLIINTRYLIKQFSVQDSVVKGQNMIEFIFDTSNYNNQVFVDANLTNVFDPLNLTRLSDIFEDFNKNKSSKIDDKVNTDRWSSPTFGQLCLSEIIYCTTVILIYVLLSYQINKGAAKYLSHSFTRSLSDYLRYSRNKTITIKGYNFNQISNDLKVVLRYSKSVR